MKLTVNDTTSAKTLLDHDEIYIPAYQRPYRWDAAKSKQLFKDVTEYLKSLKIDPFRVVNVSGTDRVEYFTGATVTAMSPNDKTEIIDGQQRSTTFYLVAFVKYLISARAFKEKIDAEDARALDILQDTLEIRNLVFKKHEPFEKLTDLKARVDEGEIEFREFLAKSGDLIDLVTYSSKTDGAWELKINYARARIKKDLTAALSGCRLGITDSGFKLEVADDTVFPTESYQTTIESCLEWLTEELGSGLSTTAMLKKADNLLYNFLDVSCVCNIKAETQKDAYTLFEILNDRSAPLKDLEIAKNLFYKYAFSNSDMEDDEIVDEKLDEAEQCWSEAFENGNVEDIVYLAGTMYLTRDYDLDFKKGQLADLRKSISSTLERKEQYTVDNVIKDFGKYREVGSEVSRHYRYQKKAQEVIKQIFSDSREISLIAMKYFLALQQNKVVALLTLVFLKASDESEKNKISLAAIRFSIKSLGSIELLEFLKNILASLDDGRCTDADIALFERKINNINVINTFNNWSYSKKNHVIILRTAISFYAATNGEKIGYHHVDLRELPNWNRPEEFDLDHVIPKSKYEDVVEVSAQRANEGSKVNSIGNMMLLGDETNRADKRSSISFLVGETDIPSEDLCRYTHAVNIRDSAANKYIKEIRDIIAKHNIQSLNEKVKVSLADDIRDYNLRLIERITSS